MCEKDPFCADGIVLSQSLTDEDEEAEVMTETPEEREMRELGVLCAQLYTLMFKCLEDQVLWCRISPSYLLTYITLSAIMD